MIEGVKNVAAVVGCVLSCTSLLALIIKPVRKGVIDFIRNKAGRTETETQLSEILEMLQKHIEEDKLFRDKMECAMEITTDFTERQCRNIIKNIFYKYKDEKVLPLYEKKTLKDMEELYIKRMRKNHWGQLLIDEMNTWQVDCSSDEMDEIEDS